MQNYTFYKMATSDFRNFWFLTPKKQNFVFSKLNAQKFKKHRYKKRKIYYRAMCYQHVHKISNQHLFFGCAMAQNPSNGNDVTFLKLGFWNFSLSYDKTNDIFGILRQNFKENFDFQNLTFLT